MTQEFHISVTPVGNDQYLVRTERVAPGVPLAEEQIDWPVDDWLVQARQLMNDPLMGILQGNPPPGAAPDRINLAMAAGSVAGSVSPFASQSEFAQPPFSLVELGQQLYSALFRGTLRDSWVTAQGIAQNRNEALRLRLGLKGTRLPRLPWEVLYGNDTPTEKPRSGGLGPAPRPLATGTHVIFSRYHPNVRLAAQSLAIAHDANQPLRVLMVIAAPTDRERLELEREAHQLQQELAQPNPTPDRVAGALPDIQLTILKQPGREQLTQALEQGRYQVLHYAGHSDLGSAGGSLYLVNNRTGLTEILSGDDLAGLLVNNGIRLAVFNSCRGAYTATSNPSDTHDRNLAEALVSRGIPAVLAMAEQIPDNVALTLTWLFYRNLKLGYPIDLSLSRARQGLISAYGSHQLYWALPILYLHPSFDGYLVAGDRSAGNPADRLILLPQSYSGLPILATEEVISPFSPLKKPPSSPLVHPNSGNLRSNAVLVGNEPANWTDDIDDLDDSYEDDVTLVAELLRQLTPPDLASPGLAPSDLAPLNQEGFSSLVNRDLGERESTSRDAVTDRPSTPSNTSQLENRTVLGTQSGAQDGGAQDGGAQDGAQNGIHKANTPTSSLAPSPQYGPDPHELDQKETSRSKTSHPAPHRRRVLPVLGVISAVAIAFLGLWSLSRFQNGVILKFPEIDSIPLPGSPNLQTADVDKVKAIAIDHFNKQNYTQGEKAVTVLLDRGALREASEALATVPTSVDTPGLSFLWGRLAWQGMETGSPVYSLQDARRYWERAAKADPENADYQEALGFAYYAENQPVEAMRAWSKALSILENRSSDNEVVDNSSEPNTLEPTQATESTTTPNAESGSEPDQDLLTAYAGIALGLWKSSIGQPLGQQEYLLQKSVKTYEMIQREDPNNFQPQALQRNWLWNDAAIRDWQSLSRFSREY